MDIGLVYGASVERAGRLGRHFRDEILREESMEGEELSVDRFPFGGKPPVC